MVDVNVTIDRMTCRVNVSEGAAEPAQLRQRVQRIAAQDVPQACQQILDNLPFDDGTIIRVRHLHLHLWLNPLQVNDPQFARQWATTLRKALAQAVRQNNARVIRRYAHARAFVTEFLCDVVRGTAWDRWYYDEFNALRGIPPARLALQFLLPRPAWIAPVLNELAARRAADPLIEAWSADEIAQLWDALEWSASPADLPRSTPAAEAWFNRAGPYLAQSGRSAQLDADHRARAVLRAWLHLASALPDVAQDAASPGYLTLWAALPAYQRHFPALLPLLHMRTEIYPALLQQIAASPLADTLAWLAPLSAARAGRELLAVVAQQIATPPPAPEAASDTIQVEALQSSVGGVVLLLPALAQMGIWERWVAQDGVTLARQFLFAVFLKALGTDWMPLYLGDALLAALAGLEQAPLADNSQPPHAEVADIAWLDAPADAAGDDLVSATVAGWTVQRSMTRALWRYATPDAVTLPGRAATESEQDDLAAEVRYLRLGRRAGYDWLTPRRDAALAVVAAQAMRRTAQQLRGMQGASLAYLGAQFFRQQARLTSTADALQVQYHGSPLSVIVKLAGLPDVLQPPWLDVPLHLAIRE